MTGADLTGAILTGANLSGATYNFLTSFDAGVDPGALGLAFSPEDTDDDGVPDFLEQSLGGNVNDPSDGYLAVTGLGQLEAAVAERDAAVAQLENEYTLTEIADLRPGSAMIAVTGESTTLSMKVEESINLIDWTDTEETADAILPAPSGKKFFRLSLAD